MTNSLTGVLAVTTPCHVNGGVTVAIKSGRGTRVEHILTLTHGQTDGYSFTDMHMWNDKANENGFVNDADS